MRLALSSLILAAGLVGAAQAQQPATPPAEPATPAAAAPATTPPAPEATPPAAAPAAPAPAVETPPPAPTLPTSGSGYEAVQLLDKICVPGVRGQNLEDLAKANGFKQNRRDLTWIRQFGADNRAYQVILYPQGSNKGVCMMDLHYAMGQDVEVAKALNIWAFTRQPPLEPTANYTQAQDPDGLKRVRRSWEYLTSSESIGLNFSTVRKPDDSPLNAKFDTATLQYQERRF